VSNVRRGWVLAALAGAYLAVGMRPLIGQMFRRAGFDPFLPAARALELRIEEGRFAEALPLAIDLDRAFPHEPQIVLWRARIQHGLSDPRREATAWEEYLALGVAAAEACPALPDAYARAGLAAEALRAYERCTTVAPDNAEAFIDLGDAYVREQRMREACAAFDRAAALDPDNPTPERRLRELQDTAQ